MTAVFLHIGTIFHCGTGLTVRFATSPLGEVRCVALIIPHPRPFIDHITQADPHIRTGRFVLKYKVVFIFAVDANDCAIK